MKYTEMILMKIGHHFGKRKPRWNFFTEQYQSLVDSPSTAVFIIFTVSVAAQVMFFLPALYWIFQNYDIIQTHIPITFNMVENIEFEKKWIVFLIFSSALFASVLNAFLWLFVYKKARAENAAIHDLSSSHDEADDQHLAS